MVDIQPQIDGIVERKLRKRHMAKFMTDVYELYPESKYVLARYPGFKNEIIETMNDRPDEVKLLFDFLDKTPHYDHNRGGRLTDFFRLRKANPKQAYAFRDWVLQQPSLTEKDYDKELRIYTRLSNRGDVANNVSTDLRDIARRDLLRYKSTPRKYRR